MSGTVHPGLCLSSSGNEDSRPITTSPLLQSLNPNSAAHVRVLKALDSGNQRAAVVVLLVDSDVVGGLTARSAKSLVLFSPHELDDTQY